MGYQGTKVFGAYLPHVPFADNLQIFVNSCLAQGGQKKPSVIMSMDNEASFSGLGGIIAMGKALVGLLLLAVTHIAGAQDALISVSTRGAQTITYWWMPRDHAQATVLLFSGGSGGMGYKNGRPESGNFLVRTRDYFASEGFNVAILGNPSDKRLLDEYWRTSSAHATDVKNVIADIRTKNDAPVWAVGTSMGTISVAAVGIALPGQLAGLVITSSITSFRVTGAVPRQDLEDIRVPVLVYHHQFDACLVTPANDATRILNKLNNASVKKLVLVTGGENPAGDSCEAFHWHGFIGMEARVVKEIADWIKSPQG